MSDKITDKETENPVTTETATAKKDSYTIQYVIEQIERISNTTSYLDSVISELRQMETPSGVGDIATQAKAQALADVVRCRETTNQQTLKLYEKMYDDLSRKSQDYTQNKMKAFENVIAHVSAVATDSPDAISDALDTIRQIYRENFSEPPKSNTVSRLDELSAWLKEQKRDEYSDEAWNAMTEAVKAQMSRNY